MVNGKVLFLCISICFNLQKSVPYLTVISFKNLIYLFSSYLSRAIVALHEVTKT